MHCIKFLISYWTAEMVDIRYRNYEISRGGNIKYYRVATAQGKQGIWLLTFPDRENTGNLVNFIFYTGKIVATQGKFCY